MRITVRLFVSIEFLAYYENLQDKLTQLKDAREALNALRSDHNERKQREALERDRQRQIQLAQKLDLMRQKKQVRRQLV
jgi:hepatocyte growth factor-regulated tyrosine kinase substrate